MEAGKSEPLSPYPAASASCGSGASMFSSAMGKLQRQLYKGEYDIFKYAQVFEGDFIQTTKKGEVIDVHNHVRVVTVGITSTSPILPLPDVMLLARQAPGCEEHSGHGKGTRGKGHKASKTLELTRLLPLKFVRMSVHDREKKQLRLKFPTGRSCYLQLCPPPGAQEDLFACWENLVYLLRPPLDSNRGPYTTPVGDRTCVPLLEEETRRGLAAADLPGKEGEDQSSTRSLYLGSEMAEATSAAFAGGQGIQGDSHGFSARPDVAAPDPKPPEPDKVSAAGAAAGTTAGTSGTAITESAAPEQLCVAVAGAATRDPGGSRTSIAIEGVANMSPESIKMAWAGAANRPSEGAASTSLSSETSLIVATAKAEPASEAAEETAKGHRATGPLLSSLPREGSVHEGAEMQQQVPLASAEAPKSRRDGRQQKQRERALRSPHHRRATESHHKPGADKILRKSSGRSLARQRNDKKEKGGGSPRGSRPVTRHKGVSHAPVSRDSRTSVKSGSNWSASSSGSTAQRLSRISSFLRTVKANLTTKTVASPRGKDMDNSTKTMDRNTEAITETGEHWQGLERIDSVASEVMDTCVL
ncbi:Golgi-associated RAB2 interactor protein 4 [Artibeus jamaicensis]|uniref:Golgi-associated RAB2 interactor protein 4 n=1 Tax=Artibeus jamaicensis TaxID=9417 RepID=UPI00235B0EA3|nr:Golgi-associated RAB2 interactor protein 4 [Artibeus jamaicensis]